MYILRRMDKFVGSQYTGETRPRKRLIILCCLYGGKSH